MYPYVYAPYYGSWRQPQSEPFYYKSPQEALALVKKAVQGEREDELFYSYLISVAPTQEEKDIITSIRDDERKHNRMFREIYFGLTGQTIEPSPGEAFEQPVSYLDGVKKAFFGELSAVERQDSPNCMECSWLTRIRIFLRTTCTEYISTSTNSSKYEWIFKLTVLYAVVIPTW
ncbi:MAG: ferritin-like domain-containing protein [Cohnella sp.]|nr:ferritin-like domain-containing protein [Cohnella sp.]